MSRQRFPSGDRTRYTASFWRAEIRASSSFVSTSHTTTPDGPSAKAITLPSLDKLTGAERRFPEAVQKDFTIREDFTVRITLPVFTSHTR